MLVEIGARLLEPWPLKIIFDRVLMPNSRESSNVGWFDGMTVPWLLVGACLTVVIIAIVRGTAAYLSTVFAALAGNRALTAIRNDLFDHLIRLPLRFHHRHSSGDLITRVVTDVGRLQEVLVTALLPLIVHSLMLVGMITLMLVMNWRLGLLGIAVAPLIVLFNRKQTGRIRSVAREQRKREGQLAAAAGEALGSVRLIQSMSLEDSQSASFRGKSAANLREGVRARRIAARLERGVDILIAVGTALVLWVGADMARRGEVTPGDLIVFLAYLKNAFKPVRDLAKYTGRLAKAAASGERVIEILDEPRTIHDASGHLPAPASVETLAFEGVTFEYKPGVPALREVSFLVERGQTVALVGPSGAGKSTILALLMRLCDPTAGMIRLDGLDARSFNLAGLRQSISPVIQDGHLFAMSIRDNVRIGMPDATDGDVVAACKQADAHSFIQRLVEGYDTVVSERGETLSGGERQRIALARAAIRQAPILILDEPTTGLDNASRQSVLDSIERLGRDRVTIIIAHDLDSIRNANEILYIERGSIIERGTHEHLMAYDNRYAAMVRKQSRHREGRPGRASCR
jgi:ATP-binding cassette, subfamily B, bacterial